MYLILYHNHGLRVIKTEYKYFSRQAIWCLQVTVTFSLDITVNATINAIPTLTSRSILRLHSRHIVKKDLYLVLN